MVIILEGVDGSGKTTLAKELIDRYGYHSWEGVPRMIYKPNELYCWENSLAQLDPLKTYILDRSWVTEFVYRLCDEEPTYLTLADFHSLFKQQRCKIIWCTNENAFEDSMARGETNITTKTKSNQIAEMYSTVMRMIQLFMGTPIYKYDFRKDSCLDPVLKFINA